MTAASPLAASAFISTQQVRFAHCDAAGIIFYPRALELLNAAQEDWFSQGLGWDYYRMHLADRRGVPTVELHCAFKAPLLLGDAVDFSFHVEQVGRSSLHLRVDAHVGGMHRMTFRPVLVCMDLDRKKAAPWPPPLAEKLNRLAPHSASGADAGPVLESSEIS